MGAFRSFSNEILHQIVVYLVDESRKQDYFDPIGIKDLQTARLLCDSMKRVATPFLFENMVLDERFGEEKDVKRMLIFAENNPELAKFVRRLQRKIVPYIGSWSRLFTTSMAEKLIMDHTNKYTKYYSHNRCSDAPDSEADNRRLCDLLLEPIREDSEFWVCHEESVIGHCSIPRYCMVCPFPLDDSGRNSQTANLNLNRKNKGRLSQL